MKINNNMMELHPTSSGLMYNCGGGIMIRMIFRDMRVPSFWIILPIVSRYIRRLPGVSLLLIWRIICILLLGITSLESGHLCFRLLIKSWKLILPSMSLEKESEKVYNSTPLNQLSHTWTHKTTLICSWTRLSGLWMIPMFTESPFIRHSKET